MVPHGTVEQEKSPNCSTRRNRDYAAVVMGVPDASKGEALVLLTTLPLTVEEVRGRLLGAACRASGCQRSSGAWKESRLGTGNSISSAAAKLAMEPAKEV